VTPEELGRLFSTFERSAFRLECLPTYDVTEDDEAEAFRLWLAGRQPPKKPRDWPRLVASATASGKRMQRVRVIRAMTAYLRFQLSWGYPDNVAAGEDIRILQLRTGESLAGMPEEDYWLFDDAVMVRLEYDGSGRFLRPVAVRDPAEVRRRCDWRDAVMGRAVSLDAYRTPMPS
jgi:hypothetical protein